MSCTLRFSAQKLKVIQQKKKMFLRKGVVLKQLLLFGMLIYEVNLIFLDLNNWGFDFFDPGSQNFLSFQILIPNVEGNLGKSSIAERNKWNKLVNLDHQCFDEIFDLLSMLKIIALSGTYTTLQKVAVEYVRDNFFVKAFSVLVWVMAIYKFSNQSAPIHSKRLNSLNIIYIPGNIRKIFCKMWKHCYFTYIDCTALCMKNVQIL